MALIDTHAHLDDERFAGDLAEVLHRAQAAGVCRVVTVATTAASSATCVDLAARFPILAATVGIQPNEVALAGAGDWDAVVARAQRPGVVALGETGLDRYWDRTPFAAQEDYFARHLALARQIGRPVVIHCREAEAEVARMLREDFNRHGPIRAVMHSFTGSIDTARACLEMGLYISFAGMLTYKNAQPLRDVAAQLPQDRVVVETDSPYLAPVPKRGQRNEPAFVSHTAACLADLLGLSVDALAERTMRNTQELFGL